MPTISFTKFEKLIKASEFVKWRRRVKVLISQEDPTILCFKLTPPEMPREAHRNWISMDAKGKSTIILCIGDAKLEKIRHLVDEAEATAKDALGRARSHLQNVFHKRSGEFSGKARRDVVQRL